MVICGNCAVGHGMRASVIFTFPKSQNRFKPVTFLSNDFLANILLSSGHLFFPHVFPGKTVRLRSIYCQNSSYKVQYRVKILLF